MTIYHLIPTLTNLSFLYEKNCEVGVLFVYSYMFDFTKSNDDKMNEMYVSQMINYCKKNESIEFFTLVLFLLKTNKHIYGNSLDLQKEQGIKG